ncbi:MAG: hypothetical protein ONB31_03445 [candidate division KSB1 bacterium]|nr:hypothetical protein [candidate division KSB1 bacterium]MDZ7334714.1 hypothetical protein [candidate division KSB1 bacterium]MDZ7356218.1 hypothetical protein [candidate division KSB1 bacterium]MDZ7400361.1 hypothetical protein [candidate division KSB1 bacterium]
MKSCQTFIAFKIALLVFLLLSIISSLAIPKYFHLNKQDEASQCVANQIIVETALAIAYAESLALGNSHFPTQLSPSMFSDGQIPTCPVNHQPISFDLHTGKAFCPNHIQTHRQE